MRYSIITLLSVLLLSLCLFSAFQAEELISRDELIEAAAEKKINDFAKKRRENCTKKIMKRANELVDSILIDRARNMTIDTFQKPPIPIRPDRPIVPDIEDTLAIAPLITTPLETDSLLQDSISIPSN